MKIRAAVFHKVHEPLTIETVEMDAPRAREIVVRIVASGVCHSDLHVIEGLGRYPTDRPFVLGHEGAGVVAEVGAAVTRVKPGDHVVCSWNPHCGHCYYCVRDQPILCEPFVRHQPAGRQLDGGIRYRRADGGALHHFSVMSSHAEYCVVPESGAITVPREIPEAAP